MEVNVNVRRIVDVKIPTLEIKTKEGGQEPFLWIFGNKRVC